MMEFSDFIAECGLVDLDMSGGLFTWSNGRNFQSWSRIDRFLVSSCWESVYPELFQRRMPRLFSDHFPLLLEGVRLGGAKKAFSV